MPATLSLKSAATRRDPLAATAPATDAAQAPPKRQPHELQAAFLAGNLGHTVTVYLVNGIKLVGKLRQYDQFCLLLSGDTGDLLVYKHAVSTLTPGAPRATAPREGRL